MTNAVQINNDSTLKEAVEQAITAGNLTALTSPQRLYYYNKVCESMGLNPFTRPLDFIQLNGKLVLYVKKDGTDQLRKIHGVSITKIEQVVQEGCCVVTAYAKDKNGKEDSDVGAVPVANLKGDAYANAIMKAVTKAKRRVTLSISGLGLLDESEIETIPGAVPESVDSEIKIQGNVQEANVGSPTITKQQAQQLGALAKELGLEPLQEQFWPDVFEEYKVTLASELTEMDFEDIAMRLKKRIADKKNGGSK